MHSQPHQPEPPHADEGEDLRLVAAARAGSAGAWATILRRYQDMLFTTALRMLGQRQQAEDAVQDAMVKIVAHVDRFDGRSKLSTWMTKIVMNTCLSALRARKLRAGPRLGDDPDRGAVGLGTRASENRREPVPGSGVEEDEERAALVAALAKLEDDQRAILTLRDGRGLDYDQIGQILDMPIGTVKSRLFRARVALRGLVEQELGLNSEAGSEAGSDVGFGEDRHA